MQPSLVPYCLGMSAEVLKVFFDCLIKKALIVF